MRAILNQTWMYLYYFVLDGAAIVHLVKPNGVVTTFIEYANDQFLPYLQQHLHSVQRSDVVWDRYLSMTLKTATRQRRGRGIRYRVQSNVKLPGNWEDFLKLDTNKTELFYFLAE